MTNPEIKIMTEISEVQFATNANGLISTLLRIKSKPELDKFECYGVGFGIGSHVMDDNKLPYHPGDLVSLDFNDKGELLKYQIVKANKRFTKLPRTCVACGTELRSIKSKGVVEAMLCPNITGCTAQSTTPIYRLAMVASDHSAYQDDVLAFISQYPDSSLTHLSDLKIFLKSDPNTASREAHWKNLKAHKLESQVWNLLNKTSLEVWNFWYIGFNIQSHLDPREVLQAPNLDAYPEIIKNNIDRVSQLVKFFDHWKVKTYVGQAK